MNHGHANIAAGTFRERFETLCQRRVGGFGPF
jgi:hypothetical protein